MCSRLSPSFRGIPKSSAEAYPRRKALCRIRWHQLEMHALAQTHDQCLRKVYGLRSQQHISSRLSGCLKLLSLRLFDCRTEVDESIIYCTNPKVFMLSLVSLACNPVESVSMLVCWLCTSGRLSTSCSLERNSNSMIGSDELNPWFIHNAYAAFSFSHCDDQSLLTGRIGLRPSGEADSQRSICEPLWTNIIKTTSLRI